MRVPWNWLREFAPVEAPPEEVAERLTMAGLEVAKVEEASPAFRGVRVGKILKVSPHPKRADLKVCLAGAGKERAEFVCGAPNVRKGILVPVALPGAVLPGGRRIETREIGGVTSTGMACSEAELSLGQDAAGLMVLDPSLREGGDLAEELRLEDRVFEIDVTPNRADALSVLGVARDVAALYGLPLHVPRRKLREEGGGAGEIAAVEIEAPDLCPGYSLRIIEGVRVGPSPLWVRRRLELCAVRPINNVVDCTNYVLLERGQPLHAFDLHRLREPRIIVRRARPGESLRTLDGDLRTLEGEVLVIADPWGPVALAGIMGGEETEVAEGTGAILLESAYFDRIGIRRTARRLGLSTEASYRFERGVDPLDVAPALDESAALISDLSGGRALRGVVQSWKKKFGPWEVGLRVSRCNGLLGFKPRIPAKTIRRYLERLGLHCREGGKGELRVTVPTFRQDLKREVDLVEEVARLHGYDRLPSVLSVRTGTALHRPSLMALEGHIREALVGMGCFEVITTNLLAEGFLKILRLEGRKPYEELVRISNPVSEEMGVMRTTLFPSLLEVLGRNRNRGAECAGIFELGKRYLSSAGGPPREERLLAIALMGARNAPSWCEKGRVVDFFDLKGIVEGLFKSMDDRYLRFEKGELPLFREGRCARLFLGTVPFGWMGEVEPEVASRFGLDGPVYAAELELEAPGLEMLINESKIFRELPRFPAVERDMALVVNRGLPAGDLIEAVKNYVSPGLLERVGVFDVYEGDQIPSGKKSIGLSLRYRSLERTLTEDDIVKVQEGILRELFSRFGAVLRETSP